MATERVYQTARGGYLVAAVMAFEALWLAWFAVWCARRFPAGGATLRFIMWLVGCLAVFAVVTAVRRTLEARNAKVLVSDEGLALVSWRGARRLIPWEQVVGVLQPRPLSGLEALALATTWSVGSWLGVEVRDTRGRERKRWVAHHYGLRSPTADELRDVIVSRRDLSEVERPRASGFTLVDSYRHWR